ncbi:hypothetical protein GCM10009819_08490 [Agromyces tropicus]|uniref:Uncharacterized protein n=1 Tax=Agromyces tropicus TaxID=555371 RepID=A0ABN2U3H4_9MICO
MKFKGPFRDPVHNAWWNITICGALVVGFASAAVRIGDEMPHLWGMLAGAVVLEGLFVYSLFKARRDVE